MTENDLQIARDVGALQADVRTVKHDIVQISSKIDGVSAQISRANLMQARGLGFFAGAAFIITSAGSLLIAFAKLIWGAHT